MELDYALQEVGSLSEAGYDGIVVVSEAAKEPTLPAELLSVIKKAEQIDADVHDSGAVLGVELPAKRLIYAPTGKITADFHDVRQFGEAAKKGILRALKSGSKSPLIVLVDNKKFDRTRLVTLLGALEGLYMNLQWREDRPEKSPKVKALGVWSDDPKGLPALLQLAGALETGRVLARDIGGPDPERMTPINVEKAVRGAFPPNSGIKLEVISDEDVLNKEYPLYSAVNRAASVIDRHKGRIIYLTYEGSAATQTLLIVGKGVTYDTGGADIKAGGIMAGMCRDKCGSAAVAGFMKNRGSNSVNCGSNHTDRCWKALASPGMSSQLVLECFNTLCDLAVHNKMHMEWVLGHCGTGGIEKADVKQRGGKAKLASVLGITKSEVDLIISRWSSQQS